MEKILKLAVAIYINNGLQKKRARRNFLSRKNQKNFVFYVLMILVVKHYVSHH